LGVFFVPEHPIIPPEWQIGSDAILANLADGVHMDVSTAPLRDAGGTIVGGDFHSVEDLDEHCTVYFTADVIGHGIAAAPCRIASRAGAPCARQVRGMIRCPSPKARRMCPPGAACA
jgi:hypothetical protein